MRRLQLGDREIEFPGAVSRAPCPPAGPQPWIIFLLKSRAPSKDTKDSCPPTHPSVSLIRPHLLPSRPHVLSSHTHGFQTGPVEEADPFSLPLLPQPREDPPPPHPHWQPNLAPSAAGNEGPLLSHLQVPHWPRDTPYIMYTHTHTRMHTHTRTRTHTLHAQPQLLFLNLSHVPVPRARSEEGVWPTPQGSGPHARGRCLLLLSTPSLPPYPAPQKHSWPPLPSSAQLSHVFPRARENAISAH